MYILLTNPICDKFRESCIISYMEVVQTFPVQTFPDYLRLELLRSYNVWEASDPAP